LGLFKLKQEKILKFFSPSAENLRYASTTDYAAHAEAAVTAPTSQAPAGLFTPKLQSGQSMVSVDTSYVTPEVFGEAIGSLRPLLKRYTHYLTRKVTQTATAACTFQTFQPRFPYLKWDDGANRHTRGFSMVAYCLPSYLLVSGGTRFKVRIKQLVGTTGNDMLVTRALGTVDTAGFINAATTTSSPEQWLMDQTLGLSYSGAAVFYQSCDIIEVELPDMYGLRARNTRTILSRNYTDTGLLISMPYSSANADTTTCYYNTFVAGADDLSFYGFCGPPVIYFYGSPTAN